MTNDAQSLPELITALRGADDDAFLRACRSLQAMGSKAIDAVPALCDNLDRTRDYRDKSVSGHWGSRDLADAAFDAARLIDARVTFDCLKHGTARSRIYYLARLPDCATKAKPIFLAALRDDHLRWSAIEAIKHTRLHGKRVIAALVGQLNTDDLKLKIEIIEMLGAIGPAATAAVPALNVLRLSPDIFTERFGNDTTDSYHINSIAREALEKILPKGAEAERVFALSQDVRSADLDARFCACKTLGDIGPAAHFALPFLCVSLGVSRDYWDKNNPKQWEHHDLAALGFDAMCRIDAESTFHLLTHFLDQSNIKWLSRMRGRERTSMPIFLKALRNRDTGIRRAAIRALGRAKISGPKALAALLKCLSGSSIEEKIEAIEALGEIGPPAAAAVPVLTRLLTSREAYDEKIANDTPITHTVSEAAREAIKKIAPTTGSTELL